MPFIQFVDDQPVYAYVVELKYENPERLTHILSVLGSFDTDELYERYTGCLNKKNCLLKMLTKENLLAIDCKHVLRAVSVLTFGSFTLYKFNLTIVYFSKKL